MENPLSYLGEVGFPLAEVHRLQETLQLSVNEIAENVKRMIDRGEDPFEGIDAETGTFNAELADWPEPEPFDADVRLPSFPLDALPPEAAAFTAALAESTQTPPELGGLLSLVVLSTCFQKRFTVEITPDWSETLSLYAAAVAASGERKSPVIAKLFAPVRLYEEQRKAEDRAAVAQNQAKKSLLEKRLAAAEKSAASVNRSAAKPKVTDDEVLALAAELAEFQDARFLRLLCEDITVEKLGVLLDEQNGGITVASDEGDIFSNLMGRYDQAPQVALFLQAYSGSPVTVDRLTRPAIYLASPRMSIAVTCQPAVLADVVSNQLFQSRGLVARFLFTICRSQIGSREITPAPIRDEVKQGYHEFVTRLLDDQTAGVIHLGIDADILRVDFQQRVEILLGEEWIEGSPMREWGSKLVGNTVRIAALRQPPVLFHRKFAAQS